MIRSVVTYRSFLLLGFLLLISELGAQDVVLEGSVQNSQGDPIVDAEVTLAHTPHWDRTDSSGVFRIEGVPSGTYDLQVFAYGYRLEQRKLELDGPKERLDLKLDTNTKELDPVSVQGEAKSEGPEHLRAIDGMGIYAGKKSEVVRPEESGADRSSDKARELFSEVAGVVGFEDGDGGLQMDIGSRGLNPKRSAHFNMRQNGYDMSADALGYPEAYYTPPSQAVDRIEIVRGAASLQYGPQFGGMVNFELRGPPEKDGIRAKSHQTLGSFNFFDSYVEVGGRSGGSAVQAFYQRRSGDGWREHSEYEKRTAHVHLQQQLGDESQISFEYSNMGLLKHQPGGLTEELFLREPSRALRERNWFQVQWNMGALKFQKDFGKNARFDTRFFGLLGQRNAVGVLTRIDRADHGGERLLLKDRYRNFGNETRYLQHYEVLGERASLLVGGRYYQGNTHRRQGSGSDGHGPDFSYLEGRQLDSDFRFPSRNIAFFAENVFWIGDNWSITPGLRYERIRTASDGWYHQVNRDLAGNVIHEATIDEHRENERDFLLYGIGIGHRLRSDLEIYGNFSTNYRGIGFNDMRLVNPNFEVDPNLEDESGYTGDLGVRGKLLEHLDVDVSLFTLYYSDRIGAVLQVDEETYRTYRLRTNIADSRNFGIESYIEWDLTGTFGAEGGFSLRPFLNLTRQEAYYTDSDEPAFEGNRVEMAPEWNVLSGFKGAYKDIRFRYQLQYRSHQYADATNAHSTPSAEVGLIPAFWVSDLSMGYKMGHVQLQAGVHNLFDRRYFTHRAKGYSGPGIVPAPPRNFYLTLTVGVGED